ncbi:hypothetical protein CALVIDRAFT_33514 [Calocera viscosa TUFC12733]|uniref:Uncharacterized protein n=1 Tax=Calocera viscosa (strain TUFC12733) TaxID=1330018 RepID=A0A167FQU9_CALVF|nr:hypothetical protein CALVIDRAFT_33514 [Calocera viscosa TUFC12733]
MAPSTSDPDEPLPLLVRAEAMVNITLDDTSPFITYSDGWGIQSPQDPDLDYYFQDTYHGTETVGANATIVFSGSGVFIFGSTGPNHGNLQVSVNGAHQTFSAYSTTPLFQQCLFSSMVDASYNEVILINIGGPSGNYLDLDYIITTVPEKCVLCATLVEVYLTPCSARRSLLNPISRQSLPVADFLLLLPRRRLPQEAQRLLPHPNPPPPPR